MNANDLEMVLSSVNSLLNCSCLNENTKKIFHICKESIGAMVAYIIIGTPVNEFFDNGKEIPKFIRDVIVIDIPSKYKEFDYKMLFPNYNLRQQLMMKKKAVCINESKKDELSEFMNENFNYPTNILLTPMLINDDILGVMGFYNKKDAFTNHDIQLSEILADLLVNSLHSQWLVENEITHRKAREEELHHTLSELKQAKQALESANTKLKNEIEVRHIAQEILKEDEERLESLLQLNRMLDCSEREILEFAMEEMVRITKSKIGYLHFVNTDQKTIQLKCWSANTLRYCTAVYENHYPLEKAGIWADCVRFGIPAVHNDYKNYPDKKGLPEGHSELIRHMSVPVIERNKIVAITGVGNKSENYTEKDERQLSLYANSMWEIIVRKRGEEELKKAKEVAESANRAKSIFLANMSHEIRTPMNAILGYSQILQRDPLIPDEQKGYLNIINRSGEHLLSLINEILDMSKIEAGRIKLEPIIIDLNVLLKDLRHMFLLRSSEKGIGFFIEEMGKIPRYILADEGKVRQILINILGNAFKFINEGEVILRVMVKKNQLFFIIKDTGVGIDKSNLKRIFEPFEQTREGQLTNGGTGLGLTISRQFARMMGGDISVKSEVGKGSTFIFSMKIEEAKSESLKKITHQKRALQLAEGHKGIRVLIVDDQRVNRDIVRKILEPLGFVVEEAENGKQAIEVFKKWKPKVILMDVVMPVMGGVEATKKIRRLPEADQVTIIALSASALDEERMEILERGADAFVKKPFREGDLLETIRYHAGIEYVYEENDKEPPKREYFPADAQKIPSQSLSRHLQEKICEAAELGDADSMSHWIQKISTIDSQLSKQLARYLEVYDFEQILNIMRKKHGQ